MRLTDSVVEYRITGLPRAIDEDEFESHVEQSLSATAAGSSLLLQADYWFSKKNKRTVCQMRVQTSLGAQDGAWLLRRTEFDGMRLNVLVLDTGEYEHDARAGSAAPNREQSKKTKNRNDRDLSNKMAVPFFDYIKEDDDRLERASDREQVGLLFQEYCDSTNIRHSRRLESLVVKTLRQRKLMRSKRYGDKVIVTFALDEPGDFLFDEDARDRVLHAMFEEEQDKNGVIVSQANGLPDLVPTNGTTDFHFQVMVDGEAGEAAELQEVTLTGPHKWAFATRYSSKVLMPGEQAVVSVTFTSTGVGVYRGAIRMSFASGLFDDFVILRHVFVKTGDKTIDDMLKPESPYRKKKKKFERPRKAIPPPPNAQASVNPFAQLPRHDIPSETRRLIMERELERELQRPDDDVTLYADFWKNLLWASEYQAYKDIELYDMESAQLKREGRFMVLYVPGLAEGRPSVLRGDSVHVTWKGKCYKGRVHQTRLLDVLLELHTSFHTSFSPALDTVDVRFTFSRTTFRTSHEGCTKAVTSMGADMLTPKADHVILPCKRSVPKTLNWANRDLNDEQRAAVYKAVEGGLRPLPFLVFGPPGTGKTTTLVETVYQLHRNCGEYLNILLVAPSNDAADVLVEKLAQFVPPSTMRRIIAYSRSIDQVSKAARPYVTQHLLTDNDMCAEIMGSPIIVSTVNLAARFTYYGIPTGHFGVLCVDEAGHATEPEVIGVAASLMDFTQDSPQVGQLILAGDPRQLGPVITSDLCEKFGLSVSYMERLIGTKVYSRKEDGTYPPDLVMKLLRTYRSHPAILKLPNEMFYDNELLACGDAMSTHSLAKWEHLPQQGFPIIFHAVNGENLREGTSPSWFNTQEAQEVVNYVDLLVKESRQKVRPHEIGIVTPYARQAQKIRLLLKHFSIPDVKVGSVETFQGQERRVIIISTVRAQSDLLSFDQKYNLGFVCNEKRFNVAVTRAKSLLIVVGSPSVLATDKKVWRPFLKYCKENNGWAGQAWDDNDVESDDLDEESDSSCSSDEDWHVVDGVSPAVAQEGSSCSSDEDWHVVDGVSPAVAQEGLGFFNREE